jgi:tripartite-type tricarboxylate transporter receptor subunit TctC
MTQRAVKRTLKIALVLIAALALAPSASRSQDYPNKVIRIVVPFAAGGAVDAVARTMARYFADRLGQQVYVENRPGASGNIGAEAVVQATPDGYTLLVSASTLIVNPVVSAERASFDPLKDLTQLALIAKGPVLFIVNPGVADNVQDFVAKARAKPEAFNFATGGYGSAGHMAAESFKLRAGFNIPVVLYKGTGPAFNDLVGGHISGIMDPLLTSLPLAQGKKATGLAIASLVRSPLAPDIPTFAEAGFPGFEFYTWYGLWAPAKLPADVADKIHQVLTEIGASADVRKWFESQGLDYSGVGGASFREFSLSEQALYDEIVKKGNLPRQ